jgi:hypothetical protein
LPIIRIGRSDYDRHKAPEGIDHKMPLTAFDVLGAVKADGGALRGRLDTLTLRTGGGRLGRPPLPLALPVAQRGPETCPDASPPPTSDVTIDRVAMASLFGPHPPLAPSFVDIDNAIEHAAEFPGLSAWATKPPLRCGQQESEDIPWRSTPICGIVTCGAHRANSFPRSCV